MTSNAGHRDYDENLLASAPVATKAQLQSGYNPDLLVEKATPPPSRRDVERRGSSRNSSPVEQADHEPMPIKVPFYRTRKGIIIIAVVALVVIIAAAVGGGVGGSRKKAHSEHSDNSTSLTLSATGSSSTIEVTQGGGTLPSSVQVPDTTNFGAPITSISGQSTATPPSTPRPSTSQVQGVASGVPK